jgi:general secretion pathway protein E
MSAVLASSSIPIPDAEITQARAVAAQRRLVEVLEERLALAPDEFTARLGATVRLPVLRMDVLRRSTPAFDLLPFSECAQRGCVLVRSDEGMLLAVDDPFAID